MLVSIGYAACHWCHVMEHESFEDAEVALVMNTHFVCVKVDREERPDVDAIYMDAVQAMTGQGGWPLNAFLTPDGVPFFAGTYFPPEPRHGMPSWQDLLVGVWNAWTTQRAEIDEAAREERAAAAGRAVHGGARGRGLGRRCCRRAVVALRRAVRRGQRRLGRRAEVPRDVGDRVPAGARRGRDAAADAAADGLRRHLRPDRRRLRALLGRRALARPALREDALRQRAAGAGLPARVPGLRASRCSGACARRRSTGRCASCARTRAASRRRWTPTPRASRASSTCGRSTRSARRSAGPRRRRDRARSA